MSYISFTGEYDIAAIYRGPNSDPEPESDILGLWLGKNEQQAHIHVYSEKNEGRPVNTWSDPQNFNEFSFRRAGAEMDATHKHASFSFTLDQSKINYYG